MGTFIGWIFRQLTFKPQPLPSHVRLDGKTAIVTGANVGLGLEAAKELVAHGLSRLILAVRNADKGEAARQEILRGLSGPEVTVEVEVWNVDHESFESIDAFGKRVAALDRLDLVILSAGVKNLDYVQSRTGHESNVQVNHLGTAIVSLHVLDALDRTATKLSSPSRLTIVSSENHFWCRAQELKAGDMLAELDSNRACFQGSDRRDMERYNTSKLLNVLWARELSDRVSNSKLNVVINTVNPGLCASSLHRSDLRAAKVVSVLAWTATQGGHCLSDAATQHEAHPGAYISEQAIKTPSAFVLSPAGRETQAKLWRETTELLMREAPAIEMIRRLGL